MLNRGWALVAAKGWFVVSGYVLVVALTRLLPREAYGDWFIANAFISFVGTILISGTLGSVSHQVARPGAEPSEVRRAAVRAHTFLGVAATIALATGARPIADLLGDPAVARLLLIASPIPGFYAVYATHVGVMNGLRRYGRQAVFDAGFSTLKCALVVAAVAAGFGAMGAVAAFTVATALVVVPAAFASRAGAPGTPGTPVRARDVLRFSAVTLAHIVAMNAALHVDAIVVKARLGSTAVAAFGGAIQIARVPLQIVIALTLVFAPVIASRIEEHRAEDLRSATGRLVRYALSVAGCAAAVFAASAPAVVEPLLGTSFADAAPVLRMCAPGMALYVVVHVCTSGLVAAGRPRLALLASGLLVATQTLLVLRWTVPGTGVSGAADAATATLVASGVAALVAVLLLHRVTGFVPGVRTAVPVLVAGLVYAASLAWVSSGWGFALELATIGTAAALALAWSRSIPLPAALDARVPRAPWAPGGSSGI